jgi:glucose-1-phosphate adenylyltransferase
MVPQTGSGPGTEDKFAHGNGDLLLRMARDIAAFDAPFLLVSSADHVFSADLRTLVEEHASSDAVATVLTAEVSRREAGQNVTVLAGADGRVSAVEEKPARPSTGTVATEVFVYRTEPLLQTLGELRSELSADADGDDSGIGDFATHLLPRLVERGQVRAVPISGYWRDLGRPAAYLQGHRDLLAGKVDVHDPHRPVISKWADRQAARLRSGAVVADSLVSPGCDVAGEVVRSVLGPGVVVEPGARVEDCVLFDDVVVRRHARLETCIVDERCEVGRNAVVGALPPARREVRDEHLVLIGQDCVVDRRAEVPAGSRLDPGATA